jgi:hypothetical protein
MDGRWGIGREQGGELSTGLRLDDERATGGGPGVQVMTSPLNLKAPSRLGW